MKKNSILVIKAIKRHFKIDFIINKCCQHSAAELNLIN